MPRLTIWAQALVDFIVKYYMKEVLSEAKEELDAWELHIDRSLSKDGSGAKLILAGIRDQKLEYALRLRFFASINEAEYEVLIQRIELTREMGVKRLMAHSDS